MKDKTDDIWTSISSFLEGNYTEEEKRLVDDWLAEDERNVKFLRKLQDVSFCKELETRAADARERIYVKTQDKISRVQLKRKLRLWQYVAVASIALLFVISGLRFLKTEEAKAPVYVETKSPSGSTTRLSLSDGTVVELNASSSISYPLYFQGSSRLVSITGEAYFEVAKDAKHPFIVEANGMKIQVLGTHFNVKSYEDDNKQVTTLMEGAIRVEIDRGNHSPDKPIVLTPNQQIIFDKNTNEISVHRVDADLYASWKDGQCFFENEKLTDIAKILERHFGVHIAVTSPRLGNQLFSGFFTRKEGLLHILNSFKKNRNLDYRQNETGIEIYEK